MLLDRRRLSPAGATFIWVAGLVHLTKSIVDASPLIIVVLGVLAITSQRLLRADQLAVDPDRVLPIQDSYSVR